MEAAFPGRNLIIGRAAHLMDHVGGSTSTGIFPGSMDKYHSSRRPNACYIPRYRNVTKKDERFLRGFGFQGGARRLGWQQGANGAGVGADLSPPGLLIHEMGTARMGRDPRTSVLNQHNQARDVPNLFVTDGAAMTSSACQLRGDR